MHGECGTPDAKGFQFVLYSKATLTDCNGERHPLREGVMSHCPI